MERTRRRFDPKVIFSFSHLEKSVQTHLKNVYSTLAIGLLAAAAGGYVHLFTHFLQSGFLSMIASIGLLVAILFTPHTRENIKKRLAYFVGFAFCTGLGLGPLMQRVLEIDPSIIPTAFMGTSVIFICFSLASLLTPGRQYLYLGGTLLSGMSLLFLMSMINLFARSPILYTTELYLGFGIFCVFVLYDTQLIVEKKRNGDDDFIWQAVDLFIDFVEIFRHLMVILAKKNKKDD